MQQPVCGRPCTSRHGLGVELGKRALKTSRKKNLADRTLCDISNKPRRRAVLEAGKRGGLCPSIARMSEHINAPRGPVLNQKPRDPTSMALAEQSKVIWTRAGRVKPTAGVAGLCRGCILGSRWDEETVSQWSNERGYVPPVRVGNSLSVGYEDRAAFL